MTETDVSSSRASVPFELFRERAAEATLRSGLQHSRHDALIREMVDHLTEAWEAARTQGLSADEATRMALRAFGLPETVRRGLTRERLLADLLAALALPSPLIALILSDSVAGAFVRGRQFLASRTDGIIYATGAIVLSTAVLATGIIVVRFGWRQCRHGIKGSVTTLESLAGAGFVAAGVGLPLLLGPGVIAPAFCNLLDLLAGRELPFSLVALSGGITAGFLGLLVGAWFRDVGTRTTVEG